MFKIHFFYKFYGRNPILSKLYKNANITETHIFEIWRSFNVTLDDFYIKTYNFYKCLIIKTQFFL